jgi:hypothetical protein
MTLRAAIFLAAAGSLLAPPPAAIRYPASRQGPPIEYRGFMFSAGSCEGGPSACARSIPKAWSLSEIDVVKSAIDEILARTDGANVVERTQQRGVTVLRRYGVFIGRSGPVPAAAALRRDRILSAIEVYDTFFTSPGERDSFSGKPGFLLVSAVLLHECMHALDDVSRDLEYLKVAGFVRSGDRWHFAVNNAEEAAVLSRFNQEFARYEAAGDFMGEWRLGRAAAMTMRPVRAPTIQATVRPAEAFAETGAILVLDDNARTYLRRDLVAYFDRNVFRRSPGR